jgi:hypothetical protein
VSGDAHSLQYFAPGWLFAPQRAHFAIIDEAHSLQNFAPWGFSAEQFGQRIGLSAIYRLVWRREISSIIQRGQRIRAGAATIAICAVCV